MRKAVALIIILTGIALGIYAGLWLSFVGGIVDAVQAIRAPVLDVTGLSVGILKVMFSGVVYSMISLPIIYYGLTIFDSNGKRKRRSFR